MYYVSDKKLNDHDFCKFALVEDTKKL